jgi:hypothetical protein
VACDSTLGEYIYFTCQVGKDDWNKDINNEDIYTER